MSEQLLIFRNSLLDMPPRSTIEPRKQPRQQRAAATVEAILEATTRILEAEGLAALNTNHIAERAGVSVGSLYQYFPCKEAILTEIIRRKRTRLLEAVDAALGESEKVPLEVCLDGLVEAVIDSKIAWPHLARILEMAESFLPLTAETDALKHTLGQRIGALLAAHGISHATIAARDLIGIVRGMIDTAALAGETDRAALAVRIRCAVTGYLAETARARVCPGHVQVSAP